MIVDSVYVFSILIYLLVIFIFFAFISDAACFQLLGEVLKLLTWLVLKLAAASQNILVYHVEVSETAAYLQRLEECFKRQLSACRDAILEAASQNIPIYHVEASENPLPLVLQDIFNLGPWGAATLILISECTNFTQSSFGDTTNYNYLTECKIRIIQVLWDQYNFLGSEQISIINNKMQILQR